MLKVKLSFVIETLVGTAVPLALPSLNATLEAGVVIAEPSAFLNAIFDVKNNLEYVAISLPAFRGFNVNDAGGCTSLLWISSK
jgi:hypothetical protein